MNKEVAVFFASLGITMVLVIGVGELALRIRYGPTSLPREVGGGYPAHLVMPDETMGHTLTPGFRGKQIVPGYPDVELKINRQGIRDYDREIPPSAEQIIVVGDSFTFGHGVPFEKTWPTLLEDKIREVVPQGYVVKGGVPGFGWRQYYQQYQRLTQNIEHHPLVIVGLTVDAGERIHNGYVAKGGILVKRLSPNLIVLDGLVFEKASRYEWVNRIDAFLRSRSYFFRWFNLRLTFAYHHILKKAIQRGLKGWPAEETARGNKNLSPPVPLRLSESKRIIEYAISTLDSINEIAKTKGAKMLVLFISDPYVWDSDIALYKEALSQRGIPSLDLSQYEANSPLSWRLPKKDGHWSSFGNQEVAQIVYQFIRENRLLE